MKPTTDKAISNLLFYGLLGLIVAIVIFYLVLLL